VVQAMTTLDVTEALDVQSSARYPCGLTYCFTPPGQEMTTAAALQSSLVVAAPVAQGRPNSRSDEMPQPEVWQQTDLRLFMDNLLKQHLDELKTWMDFHMANGVQQAKRNDVSFGVRDAAEPSRTRLEHKAVAGLTTHNQPRPTQQQKELGMASGMQIPQPTPPVDDELSPFSPRILKTLETAQKDWYEIMMHSLKPGAQNQGIADAQAAGRVVKGDSTTGPGMRQMKSDWESRMSMRIQDLSKDDGHVSKLAQLPNTRLSRVVNGNLFGAMVAIVIFMNAFVIGWEVEDSMHRVLHNPLQEKPEWLVVFNALFTIFFVMELAIRMFALRCNFWFGEEWKWNVFDTLLVAISITDLASGLQDGNSTGYVRVLKTLRMVRVLRIVRVLRFFRELRRMVTSIMSSMVSLLWCLILLFIIMYVFAVIFMQAGVTYMDGRRVEEEDAKFLEGSNAFRRFYGSLGEAFYSLIKAITGGEDWGPMTEPLELVSRYYVAAFVFYVLFVIFGVLNVLAGVFLDSAAEALDLDRDWLTEAETIKQEKFVKNLQTLFNEMDINHSGSLTWSEFLVAMENPSTQALFVSNELDMADAHMVFSLLSAEAKESQDEQQGEPASLEGKPVQVNDFIKGCGKLRGQAKSSQIICLMKDTQLFRKEMHEQLFELQGDIRELLPKVQASLRVAVDRAEVL